jgi:hypothetical protein
MRGENVMAQRRLHIVPLIFLTMVSSLNDSKAQTEKQKISLDEARKLAYEAVKTHNPDADLINSPRSFDPEFYFFAATWPNPVGSPIIGYFAVNPRTGDVWDARSCELFTSPSLDKLQENIRKRLGIKRQDYLKLKTKKPMC